MSITDELDWAVSKNNLEFFVRNQLKYTVAPHHKDWIDRLVSNHRTCTVSSRDHGKTTITSIGLPLWVITCLPQIHPLDKVDNHNVIIVSNSLDQSEEIIEKTKQKIDETESLQSLTWADTNKTMIKIKEKGNSSKIESKAFGSAGIRGNHPYMAIIDDPLSESKYSLEYIKNYYFNSISGMIAPTGYQHVVGTRFAYNDLYSILAEPERKYNYKEYPALDENNKPLWEERYSYDELMQKKAELGSLSFAREYMCQPINSDASIFPIELLDKQKTDDVFEFVGDGVSRYIAAYDLARGAQAGADYFVAMVGKKVRDRIYIVEIIRKKAIGYKEQIQIMLDINRRFHPSTHYIENNNYQYVIEAIAAEQMIPVLGRTTGKQNKENSVFLIRSLLEHGLLILPFGNTYTRELMDQLILELTAFGYSSKGTLMGVGSHDDCVSALSMLVECFALFGKGGVYSGAVNNYDLPLNITGELSVDLSPVWRSQTLIDLGIQ